MRTIKSLIAALAAALALGAQAAPAASANSIKLEIKGQVEQEYTNEQGQKAVRLVPITKIVPGDEVIYTITYENVGKQPASDVIVHDPIPKEVAYKDGTAIGAGTDVEFSADGGKTYGKPAALTVKGADGKPRAATADDYTHVRWKLAGTVAPGQKGFVRFRGTLR